MPTRTRHGASLASLLSLARGDHTVCAAHRRSFIRSTGFFVHGELRGACLSQAELGGFDDYVGPQLEQLIQIDALGVDRLLHGETV
jgi:hypothetical protein